MTKSNLGRTFYNITKNESSNGLAPERPPSETPKNPDANDRCCDFVKQQDFNKFASERLYTIDYRLYLTTISVQGTKCSSTLYLYPKHPATVTYPATVTF